MWLPKSVPPHFPSLAHALMGMSCSCFLDICLISYNFVFIVSAVLTSSSETDRLSVWEHSSFFPSSSPPSQHNSFNKSIHPGFTHSRISTVNECLFCLTKGEILFLKGIQPSFKLISSWDYQLFKMAVFFLVFLSVNTIKLSLSKMVYIS